MLTASISTVDYQHLNRGTTSISAADYQHLGRSLPASQPLTLPASQPSPAAELPLYEVLHKSLNLSGSLTHEVFARSRSRRHSPVAPRGADWSGGLLAVKDKNKNSRGLLA